MLEADLERQLQLYIDLLKGVSVFARRLGRGDRRRLDHPPRRADGHARAAQAPARRRAAHGRAERGARHLLPQQRPAPVRDALAGRLRVPQQRRHAPRGHPAPALARVSRTCARNSTCAGARTSCRASWTACWRRSSSRACSSAIADGAAWRRSTTGSAEAVRLSVLAQATIQTIERYYLAIALLLRAGRPTLTPDALEQRCVAMAQRMSMLYGLAAPEFFDRAMFRDFIDLLRQRGVVRQDGDGRLDLRRRAARRRRGRAHRAFRADPQQHPAGHPQLIGAPRFAVQSRNAVISLREIPTGPGPGEPHDQDFHPPVARARRRDSCARAPPRRSISPPAAGTAASTRRFPSARSGATRTRDPRLIGTAERRQRPLAEHRRRRPQLPRGPRLERVQDGRRALARSRRELRPVRARLGCCTTTWSRTRETERTPISEAGKDLAGSYLRLLDAFVYGRWDLGGHDARRARRTPGRELGREHLHPGRHQRRDQPFRRRGAARAGLGTARGLPAAGNAEGRLRRSPTT